MEPSSLKPSSLMPSLEYPVRVSLFGGPKLEVHGCRIPLSPFEAALISLVAGHEGDGLTRSTILSHFWEEGGEAQLRKRLSQLIYSVQQKLAPQPLLRTEGDFVGLCRRNVSTDVQRLYRDLRESRPLPAAALVTGGFLKACKEYPTLQFESWSQSFDRKVRSDLTCLTRNILEQAEREGAWHRATEAAAALVLLDPSDDKALRASLRAERLLIGEETGASALFALAQARIQAAKPGWSPAPETLTVFEKLAASQESRVADRQELDHPPPPEAPLIGRGVQFEALSRGLTGAPSEGVQHLGIVGEPGIGKSRLGREIANFARLSGFHVLNFECSEFEHELPLAVFSGTLGAAVPLDSAEVCLGSLGEWVIAQLQSHSSGKPLLLFFDNFQWIDAISLGALEFVSRRWPNGGLILLACARSVIPGGDVLAGQRWLLSRTAPEQLVVLPELTPDACQELLEGVLGRELCREALDAARALAGGIPAFLLSLSPIDLEPLSKSPDTFRGRKTPGKAAVPSLLAEWVRDLSPPARDVLELLAVSSQPLKSHLGASILDVDRSAWWRGLDELEGRLLLDWGKGGATLRHGLIRRHVVAQIPEGRWRCLNQSIAERFSGTSTMPAGDLALHFHHGEGGRLGRDAASVAAAQAERVGAYSEALRYSELVLGFSLSEGERVSAKVQLAARLFRFGELHRAMEELGETIPEARTAGLESEALQCELSLMSCGLQLGRVDPATVLEKANCIGGEASRSRLWVIAGDAFDLMLKVFEARDDVRGIRRTLRRVQMLLPQVDSVEGRVRLNAILALAFFYDSAANGLECARRAVAIATKAQCSDEECLQALNRLLVCLISQGTLLSEEGQNTLTRARQLAERSGDLLLRCYPVANQSAWLLDIGDPQGALETLEPVIHHFAHRAGPEGHLRVRGNRGLALLQLGDFEMALRELTLAESLMTPLTGTQVRRQLHAGIGLALLQLGRMRAAQTRADMIQPLPKNWAADPTVVASFLSTLLCRQGQPAEGVELIAEAARNIKGRFPIHWINLVLMQARLSRRVGLTLSPDLLAEASAKAEDLQLIRALRDLQRLKN
jgi:DNA-binding SARP family transcriptional activator/tetratricopeptide (TPR) repeat protein